ncbi:peptidase M28-like protein [Ulvibacter sp. MAR_2010_11]|uniref:M28 family peptidase n=1 Tax=Ulvibacter sp. MAR_2010_11 TaxID=1250229 RepID=UPI000C2CCBCE|nr:M28 family peptidase [Ulvibacter sp. MAR_2010_11]PKA83525.1 peptidase M28-like protein [Ulvibacter sp. MAR_2010_11]
MRLSLFFAFLFISFTSLFSQTDQEKVEATVSKSAIEGHIYFLADDLLKGRETGTAENKIAASYLANTLRSYGVQPISKTGSFIQEVPLQKTSPPNKFLLKIDGNEYKKKVVLEASKMKYSGNAVYLGYGMEADYKGKDVTEKMIIVKAGSDKARDARAAFGLRETKMELAKNAGALGIIEFIDAEDNIWGFIEHNFMSDRLELASSTKENKKAKDFVYLWLQDKGLSFVSGISDKKSATVTVDISDKTTENITSQNVVGMIEGTDATLKNEFIIYSAHYDHVGIGTPDENGDTIYNGARDNAVGTTTVLSMAANLAKYPTKRSALFILFTGEEKGLLGSEYYVNNPLLPLDKMVYCFNSDNAGYNDTSLATIIGLNRTTAAENIKKAATAFGLKATDDPAPEQGLFDRSDNVHFAAKGIPAPTFSLGFTAFNGTVTEYYHRPGDEANTLDYNYLLKFFQSYVLAGRLIANDPVTPFWTGGDSYEAAGKKLYNR